MSAVIPFPIAKRLDADMRRVFGRPAPVANIRDEAVKRQREASERRFSQRYGDDFDGRPAA